MKLLINQLDEHNEGNILATTRYNADEVIFIRQKNQVDLIDNIKKYYDKNFPTIKMSDVIIFQYIRILSSTKTIIINLNPISYGILWIRIICNR